MDTAAVRIEAANAFAVSPEIHEEDMIFRFLVDHPAFPTPSDAARHYFSDGSNSARQLAAIVDRHYTKPTTQPRLFEFASGFGAVTRHLPHALPGWEIVSCDIHPPAITFIEHELNGTAFLSQTDPGDLTMAPDFDVAFALSFFSHMPQTRWTSWLVKLFEAVKPGGLLVFTTHGEASRVRLGNPELNDDGFWFRPHSEQADLDVNEYGTAVSSIEFVIREIFRGLRAPLAELKQSYWWTHQDLWVVLKPA